MVPRSTAPAPAPRRHPLDRLEMVRNLPKGAPRAPGGLRKDPRGAYEACRMGPNNLPPTNHKFKKEQNTNASGNRFLTRPSARSPDTELLSKILSYRSKGVKAVTRLSAV